ncbi:unnamed protein product [Pocillopora meandrina]|uniref:Yippee domain-containing protein n=1 Tax=Pocillopora meandrina TaxID=46732 RepID=A0AAU9WKV4_9CNID|nr:unnamed protein product [Pocillopora meandrina]
MRDGQTIRIKLTGDGTNIGKRLTVNNFTFTLLSEKEVAIDERATDQSLSSVDRFSNFYECNGCGCHIKRYANLEYDILDFQVGFFDILEEDKRRMEEDEHDEDNSTRELDDFIAAERSSSTQKKISKRNASGKCLKGFANRR